MAVRSGGRPIPPERIPTLFDAFMKGDDNPAGLGLGLFIVREIVQAHAGSVAVTSSAAGTVFTFRLPRGDRATDFGSSTASTLRELAGSASISEITGG